MKARYHVVRNLEAVACCNGNRTRMISQASAKYVQSTYEDCAGTPCPPSTIWHLVTKFCVYYHLLHLQHVYEVGMYEGTVEVPCAPVPVERVSLCRVRLSARPSAAVFLNKVLRMSLECVLGRERVHRRPKASSRP